MHQSLQATTAEETPPTNTRSMIAEIITTTPPLPLHHTTYKLGPMGCTSSKENRLTLGKEFANCASFGNPNMSRKNAVVISAADLKAWGRMPRYEQCAERGQHVPIE
ncbi:unnamed protein product, partial [Heterosigma akashiwo]